MAERKAGGAGYVRTLGKRFEQAAGEVMRAWRAQARRRGRVGEVSYHGLELVHGGLKLAIRSLSRLERATEPPHRRPSRHEPSAS